MQHQMSSIYTKTNCLHHFYYFFLYATLECFLLSGGYIENSLSIFKIRVQFTFIKHYFCKITLSMLLCLGQMKVPFTNLILSSFKRCEKSITSTSPHKHFGNKKHNH